MSTITCLLIVKRKKLIFISKQTRVKKLNNNNNKKKALNFYFFYFFILLVVNNSLLSLSLSKTCSKQTRLKRMRKEEGNILFNDALNTLYLRLYGVRPFR